MKPDLAKTIQFSSDQFRPYLPDDRQVGPNTYGYELAVWLARELAAVRIVTSYPEPDSGIGWYLSHKVRGVECSINCRGRYDADADKYQWKIGIFSGYELVPGEDELLQLIARRLEKTGIACSTVTNPEALAAKVPARLKVEPIPGTRIQFTSDLFQPYLRDERRLNALGFELAVWMGRELAGIGISTSYPKQAEWGWFLDYFMPTHVMLCCRGECDGATGDYVWTIQIAMPTGKRKQLTAVPFEDDLIRVIVDRLENARISSTLAT
jgi:hypothetical protein